jgi:hypothetical protein
MKIEKVLIDVGEGKKLELTMAEAKELRDVLNSTFPEQTVTYIPAPYPVYPITYPTWRGKWWSYTSTAGDTLSLSLGGTSHE